jgi:hypothetical protein
VTPEQVQQVVEQLRAENVRRLVVFTPAGRQNSATNLALGCLYLAAGLAGDVKLEQREIKPWEND